MKRTFNLLFFALILVLIVNMVGRPLLSAKATGAQSWSRTMENMSVRVPAIAYAVWGSSARDVYAVGATVHAPLLFHNDGSGWSNASPALPAGWLAIHLFGIWGLSASDVYAVGAGFDAAGNQVPLLYHNDGNGWTAAGLSLPAGWNYGHLLSMWGSSASDVYTVGWAYNAVGYRMPLLYHNDGTGWTEAALSLPAGWLSGQLFGVWGSGANDIYAVGQGVGEFGEAFPLFYHNDGSGWRAASPSLPDGWGLFSPLYGVWGIWGSSANDVYVVGSAIDAAGNQVPLLYHNDGSGWREASPSLPAEWSSAYLRSVWGSSAEDIYAVGWAYDVAANQVPLLYHNDGTGWTAAVLSLPDGWSNGDLSSVWGSGASDVYAVGSSDDGPLLYHNDGTGWTNIEAPAIIYVDHNATGANNGISWANAYTDLQSALAAASAGDEIWVVAGTYKPTSGTDRAISFTLKNGVAIYGSFAGAETSRAERDVNTNVTVLSGDLGVVGNNSDNSYHVVVGSSTNNSAVLDGFTIMAGKTRDDFGTSAEYMGGGIYIDSGNPVLSNLIIRENSARIGNGIYNYKSSPILLNVAFIDNTWLAGSVAGAMVNEDDSSPTLTNVMFINNSGWQGGALFNVRRSNPTLLNVIFAGNSTSDRGGAIYNSSSNPILTNVTFRENSATQGGAIFNDGDSNPTLVNVTFTGNSASDRGGAIYNYYSNPTLNSVTFHENSAIQGGAIFNDYSWHSIIMNSILYGDTGGEIHNYSTPAAVNYSIVQGGYPGTGNIDIDPLLGPLQDNGGFTQTMGLSAGSPAIDTGYDANCPTTDQRGVARPQGGHCDIGAYEYQAPIISPGDTIRVSVNSSGGQGDGYSYSPSPSVDGRYVAFYSDATNLISEDTNAAADVFVHDMQTGLTTRVSVDSSNTQGNDYSFNPSISADGRYIAFNSHATNLVPGDTNGKPDVFIHDMQTDLTIRVSVDSSGAQSNGSSYGSLSADGRYIVFESDATNLVANDTNGVFDVFVHDMQTGTTTRVSVDSNGGQAGNDSGESSISADGRYIAFSSLAANLVPGDTNGTFDIFLYDIQTGITMRVSVNSLESQANNSSFAPSLSADGRYITFYSFATNLVPSDTNGVPDIFVFDMQTGMTTRVSIDSSGVQANGDSMYPSVSADGRYIAFEAHATNLVTGDNNAQRDIFVHDAQLGTTKRVSVDSTNVEANDQSGAASISADGHFIAFTSIATNLVTGDTNLQGDVFVHENDISPTILSIIRASADNPGATSVDFRVSFSEPVHDVDSSDFILNVIGTITGAMIGNVTIDDTCDAYCDTYTVTVNTGSGNGTIRLDVPAEATITDLNGNSLSSLPFVTGEVYMIKKSADVNVYIHGDLQGNYALAANEGTRQSYSLNNGPVKIVSTNNIPLIGAERVIYNVNNVPTSFSEMMALPDGQLDNIYWMPWYNNVDLDTQLRFGNVSGTPAEVHVWIGGQEKTSGCTTTPSNVPYPYILAAGESLRVSCPGVNDGPVQIISNVDIVAAERVIYNVNGLPTSFTEMMGLPDAQLDNTYWMPWYNNEDLDTQLRFGNVSNSPATVRMWIGAQEKTSGCTTTPANVPYPYVLPVGASLRVSCLGLNSGPVQIVSNVNIVAAERVIYNVNGLPTSFSEMMALPNSQLDNTYWLPWYNNVDLDTQLRFGVP
jgi:predicted outer membrane repeat protein